MAARKKKTSKKSANKKTVPKKKVQVKAKQKLKKKITATKARPKKKTMSTKSTLSNPVNSAVKKASAGKQTSARQKAAADNPIVNPASKIKSRGGKIRVGSAVRAIKGKHAGETGKVVGQDPYLGTYFLIFDRYKKDSVYKDIQWGPYFDSALESIN